MSRERELIGEIVAKVDLDGIALRIVDQFLPSVRGYARMPSTLLHGEVLAIIGRNLQVAKHCILDDRGPNGVELEEMRLSAKQRGRDGLPLQDVLRAYRLGGRVVWAALTEAATADEEQHVLLHVADRVMGYIDAVSTVVALAYVEERDELISERETTARALLEALLDPLADPDELNRRAERAGFGLCESYRAFAISVPESAPGTHGRLARDLRALGLLALTEADRISGVAATEVTAARLTRPGAVATLSEPVSREDLPGALELARLRVQTALKLGHRGVLDDTDLLPAQLLARSPQLANTLRERVLGPLRKPGRQGSPELVRTLETFVGSKLDRRRAATALTIHANTLDYRLRRIEQLTGLTLADPGDLAQIVLALYQDRLSPSNGASTGRA
ncbi:PucR family transcriptional regulator [Amycolatopsis minnesotensis]|uniref:Helix-turn-helix domain-containing protein n=1 Tax=Amycolatopsis minnesotensis TaxID=337894 RepID=A0ABN2Q174_9PSEU